MSTSVAKRPVLKQLKCPACGAPIPQYGVDTQTIICPQCNTSLALDMEGLTPTGKGRKLPPPTMPIKVGDVAEFDKTNFFVLGRVIYRGWDDEDKWMWDEWLMGGDDGRLLWLSYSSDEGFTLFKKLRIREPFDAKNSVELPTGGGKTVRVHERYPAQIVGAEGELTWRGKAGDNLYMAEAFGHGKRYSVQQTPSELEIHEGVPISLEDTAKAFKNTQWLQSIQRASDQVGTFKLIAIFCILFALGGLVMAIWASSTGEEALKQSFTLTRANPTVTIPILFDRIGRASIVSVRAQGALPLPSEIDIDVSIDSPDETENDLFTLELWRESGSDDEGYWEVAQDSASDMFVPFQTGEHTLEIAMGEGTIDSVSIAVDIRRNHVLPTWFVVYSVIVGIIGGLILYLSLKKPS